MWSLLSSSSINNALSVPNVAVDWTSVWHKLWIVCLLALAAYPAYRSTIQSGSGEADTHHQPLMFGGGGLRGVGVPPPPPLKPLRMPLEGC